MSSSDLEILLNRARRAKPGGDAKARLRQRILSAASGGVALSAAAGVASATSATASGAKLTLTALTWLSAGAAIGGLVVASARALSPEEAKKTPSSDVSTGTHRVLSPPVSERRAAAEVVPPTTTVAHVEQPPEPRASREHRAGVSTVAAPSLQRETELLTEAQRALQRNDGAAALSWLRRYEREFPRGGLAEEALAARAIAICSFGRELESAKALVMFRERYENSPLFPRVSVACNKKPEP